MAALAQVARALTHCGLFLEGGDEEVLARTILSRWPALEVAPEVAHLPAAVLLRGFLSGDPRPFLRQGAASLAVFDPEVEGVAAGLRVACLKEGVPISVASDLVRAYEAMGLHAGEVLRHGLDTGSGTHREGGAFAVVAVAGSAATLAEAIELQRRSHSGQKEARVSMGRLLGYPRCCIDVFLDTTHRGDNLDNERQPFLRHPEQPLHPLLHRVALPRLISHHLCSPHCEASIAGARQTLVRMAELDRAGAAWVEAELARPVLFLDYARRVRLTGAWGGDRFTVSACEPIGDGSWMGIPPEEVTSISLAGQGEDSDVASRVAASRPLLTTPGLPLAPAALRAAQGVMTGGVVFSRG